MATNIAQFTAGRVALSAGLALSYSRPWDAPNKETGATVAANAPYFDAPSCLVGPVRPIAAGTLSSLLATSVVGAGGTWTDGNGALVMHAINAASSLGYVTVDTEATMPTGAGTWDDAALLARVVAANARTINCSYNGASAEPLKNSRTNKINILRNATAAQGESATERLTPTCFGVTNGVPVVMCKVINTSDVEISTAMCMWAENLSPTGIYADAITAAKTNAEGNQWFLVARFANHYSGASIGAGKAQGCHTWFPVAADEMWLPTTDYRAASESMGCTISLTRATKLASGLWEIQPMITLYEEPGGSSWKTHVQGAVVIRGTNGSLCVRLSRQQTEANVIDIVRQDRTTYTDGATTIQTMPITAVGTSTTIVVNSTAAWAARISAGSWLTIHGNTTAAVNGRWRVASIAWSSGVSTITFESNLGGTPAADGQVSGSTNGTANYPWFAITGGTSGANGTITFAGNATDAALFSPGDTITLRGTTASITNAANTSYTVQTSVHSAGTVTITVTGTISSAPTAAGHVSKNGIRTTCNGWAVNQCARGVPLSLAVLAGLPTTAVDASTITNYRQTHVGYLGGCPINDDCTQVIMGTDGGMAMGSRHIAPANPATDRIAVQTLNSRIASTYSNGLTWAFWRHPNCFASNYNSQIATAAKVESRGIVSADGVTWGDLISQAVPWICGRKVLSLKNSTFSTWTLPTIRTSRGLLTSWTGSNYSGDTWTAWGGGPDTGVTAASVTRTNQAAFDAALAITGRTVPLPPTLAPVFRVTNPSNGIIAKNGQYFAGNSTISNSAVNTALKWILGRIKVTGWVYNLPPVADVAASILTPPFSHDSVPFYFEFVGGTGNFGRSGIQSVLPVDQIDGSAWVPFTWEFDTNDTGTFIVPSNWSSIGAPGARQDPKAVSLNVRAGNAAFQYSDFLFCVSSIVMGATTTSVDFPVVPLPIATTTPKAAENMSWRVSGFAPTANWLLTCGGTLAKEGWDYNTEPARLPTSPRLFTLRQSASREIRVSFDLGTRAFTFTDGTNTATVASPYSGGAVTNGTYTQSSKTLTTAPNSSGGSLVGYTLFVTTNGGNNYPTRYATARIVTHSGTSITLDRDIATDGQTGIVGTINSTGDEFAPMKGGSLHIAIYSVGTAMTFIASVGGVTNSTTATWAAVDGETTRPTEFIAQDMDEANPTALAWGYVVMNDAASAGLSANDIIDLMAEVPAEFTMSGSAIQPLRNRNN